MGHRSRLTALIAMTSSVMLALAACGSGNGGSDNGGNGGNGGQTNSSGDCEVVFATNTELSGDYAIYGQPAADGLSAAAEDINAEGGVKVGDKSCKFVA